MIDLDNLDKYQVRDDRYKLISMGIDPRPDREGCYIATYLAGFSKGPFFMNLDKKGVASGVHEYDIIEKPVIEYVNIPKGPECTTRFSTERKAIEYATQHRLDGFFAVAVPVKAGLNLDRIEC